MSGTERRGDANEDELLAAIEGAPGPRRSDCPPSEQLLALAAGGLGGSERLALVDHLALCPDCAAELRLLRQLEPWALHAEAELAGGSSQRATAHGLRTAWIAAALAASVAVVCAVGWQRATRGRSEPKVFGSVPVVDLLAEGTLRAAAPSRAELLVPAPGTPLLLVLDARTSGPGPYRVEIRRDGALVSRVDSLAPSRLGNFTLLLPADQLAPGELELRLFAAAPEPLGVYRLSLRESP